LFDPAEFKPRLERILADVVLLGEIANLAEQAEMVKEAEAEEAGSWDLMASVNKGNQNLKDFLWAPAPGEEVTEASSSDNEEGGDTDADKNYKNSPDRTSIPTSPRDKTSSTEPPKTDRRAAFADSVLGDHAEAFSSASQAAGIFGPSPRMSRPLRKTESGRFKLKDMLEAWEEPESKADKGNDISIRDILKFRRALSHLDEDHPFGKAFGPAMNRDQCIASSQNVYERLLKLAPITESGDSNAGVLTFDILSLLTLNEDGKTENLAKKRMIKRIFTPDPSSGRLPLLAFV